MNTRILTIASVAISLVLTADTTGRAAELVAEVDLQTVATSNVFLDKSQEWDLSLQPSAELGLDFGTFWSAGYTGHLSAYTQHEGLLSTHHELYLFANPAWGQDGENEVVVEATVETIRNHDDYATLNLVQPTLLVKVVMEPRPWFRWHLSTKGLYRWFYDDRPNSSLDVWGSGQVTFTLPTRTTLSPGASYGYRRYTNMGKGGGQVDPEDQQLVLSMHAGQALWKSAGLQLDYAYLMALGDSGILERKVTEAQFAYLGEQFLFSGHRVAAGVKQLIGQAAVAGVSVRWEERAYAGWPAVDDQGRMAQVDRRDTRLVPRAYVSYAWIAKSEKDNPWIPEVNLRLDYRHVRQWSNSDWYDTSGHVLAFSVWGSW